MEPTLESVKSYPRAMHFYVYMLHEFVLERKCNKVLEIGVLTGQSTRSILLALDKNKSGKLVSIDHKNRSDILDLKFSEYKKYWKFIQGSSHLPEILQAAKDELEEDELYDVLLIDGDHTYEGAKQDWEDYMPLVKQGGVIFLHDTVNRNEGVNKLWDEIDFPEKFNCDWGLARVSHDLVVGMGIVKKPLEWSTSASIPGSLRN